MNVLLRASPENAPKIPAFRKQRKTLKTKNPECPLSLEHACAFSLQECTLTFLLPSQRVPTRLATRAAAGSGSVSWANPRTSKGPSFASGTCFLSPRSPTGSLLLPLRLSLQEAMAALCTTPWNPLFQCPFALHAQCTSSRARVLALNSFSAELKNREPSSLVTIAKTYLIKRLDGSSSDAPG